MWYVNEGKTRHLVLEVQCFILTMWYVNGEFDAEAGYRKREFYINYVVCKYTQNDTSL